VRVRWRRGRRTIPRGVNRRGRRVTVDRHRVLRIRRSGRRDAGRYTCLATTKDPDGRRRRRLHSSSTANTTLRFHRLDEALRVVEDRWTAVEDRATAAAASQIEGLHLGPVERRRADGHAVIPQSYSVEYIRHVLVQITVTRCALVPAVC